MSQPFKKTILVVCEGGGTESSYFESIRNILIERKIDVDIKISPKPKTEIDNEIKLREGAKKRELRKIAIQKETELKKYEIEEAYKAQPLRYVREAQMGLEDGTFDEAWAVYDKNGHPKHNEALDLSNVEVNGKRVNIAFSSISFEHWILLHFELSKTEFNKSKCREGDVVYECGTNNHAKDCKGTSCVCGYLITRKYIDGSLKKKQFLFSELPDYKTAIYNAISLRFHQLNIKADSPIYEINPITTVDRLVFRLVHLPVDFCWFDLNSGGFSNKNISITVVKKKEGISFSIKNLKQERYILTQDVLVLIDVDGKIYSCCKRELIEKESKPINIVYSDLKDFRPAYFGFKIGENQYQFSDL